MQGQHRCSSLIDVLTLAKSARCRWDRDACATIVTLGGYVQRLLVEHAVINVAS